MWGLHMRWIGYAPFSLPAYFRSIRLAEQRSCARIKGGTRQVMVLAMMMPVMKVTLDVILILILILIILIIFVIIVTLLLKIIIQ